MKIDKDNPKYLAYALDELDAAEKASIEQELAGNEELQQLVEEYKQLGATIESELEKEEAMGLSGEQRQVIENAIDQPEKGTVVQWPYRRRVMLATAASLVFMFLVIGGPTMFRKTREGAGRITMLTPPPTVGDDASGPSTPDEGKVVNVSIVAADPHDGSESPEIPVTHAPPAPQPIELAESSAPRSQDFQEDNRALFMPGRIVGKRPAKPRQEWSVRSSSHRYADRDRDGDGMGVPAVVGTHDRITENPFESARNKPLSTFSIDVDTASYSMVRQMLTRNTLPSPDAVRIEEMVNYFDYEYVQPQDGRPFSVNVDVASCPWAKEHRLVRIGLKGYEIARENRPAANIVFLLDVSGSMSAANKLGYVKASMKKLLEQLNEKDTVSIAVYAGASGLVLPATSCENREAIMAALKKLSAGGSTNGGAGIDLAYKTAVANFIKGGINRVILCTDGDFNVGVTGPGGLERLIEEKAKSGVFLTILGYGMGNFRDNSMERLSNKGNGNYAYIDNMNEANKVLVEQVGSTLVTIAKDVKIQVNFNHQRVSSYRLLGYENRMLAAKDFNDDKKDAGEIGAGHTVTALYEVVPKGVSDVNVPAVDPDKYAVKKAEPVFLGEPSNELLTVKLRYKLPDEDESTKIEVPVVDRGKHISSGSNDLKFSVAVAGFGMLLRNSEHKGNATYAMIHELATEGKGADRHDYRKEFLQLVTMADLLAKKVE